MNMGRAISALLACVLHNSGIYIFRPPTNLECFPYTAYVTFLFAVFYLLWTVPVNPFPSCFRGLVYPASLVVEFLIHVLCTELLLTDFWCPLQTKFIAFLPTIPELANDYLTNIGLDLPIVIEKLEYLKSEEALIAASYMLSIFFLLSTAHAARVVDFRLLKCGTDVFLMDIVSRIKKRIKNIINYWTDRGKCSTFKPQPCRRRRSCSRVNSCFSGDSGLHSSDSYSSQYIAY